MPVIQYAHSKVLASKHFCYILYPLVQWNHWFANSDVPFQSVTNNLLHGQFAIRYIRWMVHLNCYTRGGLHMRRVITKQLMYGSSCNIGYFSTLASGLVDKNRARGQTWPSASIVFHFCQLDQKLVYKNPMLHAEPYINYYLSQKEI